MNQETFGIHMAHMQKVSIETMLLKNGEYSPGEDKIKNFKRAAELGSTTPPDALGGMMAKHTISVYDMIMDTREGKHHPMEVWEEKIKDSINYLFLLWALVNEDDAEDEDGFPNAPVYWEESPIGYHPISQQIN